MTSALLRYAGALAHALGSVVIELTGADGRSHRIAYGCLHAVATPCELRRWLAAAPPVEVERIVGGVRAVVLHGVVDLGGGLYERERSGQIERWFTTTLGAQAVVDLVESRHDLAGNPQVELRLLPDPWLEITVGCLTAPHPAAAAVGDEFAATLLGACLAEELVSVARAAGCHGGL